MLTHHSGMPKRKLTVPSSGSTTQRRPLVPGRSSPSSPMIASAGRAASRRARISRSVATSASETRSVGVLLELISSARPNASRSPAPASWATAVASASSSSGALTRPAAVGARASRCRSRAAPRARAASPRRRRGRRAGPRREAVRRRLDGHRRGGLAGVVPDRKVRDEVRHPVEHQRRGQPAPLADQRRAARQDGRHQHVEVVEDRADPLAIHPLLRVRTVDQERRDLGAHARQRRGSRARAALGAPSCPTRRARPGGSASSG